jgi:hypothetical protein
MGSDGLAGSGTVDLFEEASTNGAVADADRKVLQQVRRKVYIRFGGAENIGQTEIRLVGPAWAPSPKYPGSPSLIRTPPFST